MTIVTQTNHGRGYENYTRALSCPLVAAPRGWNPDARRPAGIRCSAYVVTVVTEVDRPDRRDSSFAPVAPGHRIADHHYFDNAGAARRFFEGVLAGELDFASEFVNTIRFCAYDLRTDWTYSSRTVRKTIEDRPRPMIVPASRSSALTHGEFTYDASEAA